MARKGRKGDGEEVEEGEESEEEGGGAVVGVSSSSCWFFCALTAARDFSSRERVQVGECAARCRWRTPISSDCLKRLE